MKKKFIRAQRIIVDKDKQLVEWLTDSTHIYNSALYEMRNAYTNCIKNNEKIVTPSFCELYNIVKNKEDFKNSTLDYYVKTYILKQVINNWKAFIMATVSYKRNPSKFKCKPKLPKYLEKSKLNLITIDKSRLRNKKGNSFCLPKSNYRIFLIESIPISSIKCVQVLNYYSNKLRIIVVYEKEVEVNENINKDNAIGIDLGVNNLCSITSNNQPLSWIVNGRIIKSINQYANKKINYYSQLLYSCNKNQKENLTSKRLETIRAKRDKKIKYYFHLASKFIIELCTDNNIGTIVIGRNEGWKQKTPFRHKDNQNFQYVPFFDLIHMISYKAEEKGINVELTEESYTSKVDHLVLETMEEHDTYSGKRIKRGLFKSSTGKVLNADINGAIGILRKKNKISDVELCNLRDRGDNVSPLVFPSKETHKEKYFK